MPDRTYRQQELSIWELVNSHGDLEGVHLHECLLLGPAVLIPTNTARLTDNTYLVYSDQSPLGWLWDVTPDAVQNGLIGGVRVVDSHLIGCRLHRIGLALTPEQSAEHLQQTSLR